MANNLGMFKYNGVIMSGNYPCYFLALKGDLIEDIDNRLVKKGKPVYYSDGLGIYHFNGSTLKVKRNELADETLLSIYGNEKQTINKLEEILNNGK